ncbi:MAG TPA: nuclear transport factor 2 family protein [Burkholderiaceae bacterium]|nr:nuclear transport factor 2 family protein [Burkholderiaceae bacterium]
MSEVESNKELVKRLFAAFGAGDIKQIVSLLDDEATWWVSGTLSISKAYTKPEFEQLLVGMHDLVDGTIKLTPKAFTSEGNRVAVEAESFAKTKTGRTYQNLYHFLFETRNGKILRTKEYMDPMHVQAVFFDA